jgi:hypothetical protein
MFYTVIKYEDGLGAQFQTIIFCILIAESEGNEYAHNEIEKIEHNYDNCPNFVHKIEQLMNIKPNYTVVNELNDDMIIYLTREDIIKKFEINIDKYLQSNSLKKIKEYFWENKKRDFFKNDKLNIAVHIRRPNCNDNRIYGTNTSIEFYFNIIRDIKEKYANHKKQLLFHIYSQNELTDYDTFDKNNLQFHLNENLLDTFVGMVAADILITSASSLSYSAAILSDGIIYYHPFWHPPSQSWIRC